MDSGRQAWDMLTKFHDLRAISLHSQVVVGMALWSRNTSLVNNSTTRRPARRDGGFLHRKLPCTTQWPTLEKWSAYSPWRPCIGEEWSCSCMWHAWQTPVLFLIMYPFVWTRMNASTFMHCKKSILLVITLSREGTLLPPSWTYMRQAKVPSKCYQENLLCCTFAFHLGSVAKASESIDWDSSSSSSIAPSKPSYKASGFWSQVHTSRSHVKATHTWPDVCTVRSAYKPTSPLAVSVPWE